MLTLLSIAVILALRANSVITCDTETLSNYDEDDSPAGILKLLREGEKRIQLEEKDRDMVVLMGITGSGKTTFALYVGGYDNDLTSIETRPYSGDFIIDDRRKRSSSASRTLESCTLIPTPFVDCQTKKTLIDMPGFSDTRPPVMYDIAATYFSKKVLDYARRVKLLFLVNHSHVRVGEDRGRFSELVAHITTMVRNVSKFDEGIALIATKVANSYRLDSTLNDPYASDDVVVAGIADFIKDARAFYSKNNQTEAAQLMDILLRKKNDEHTFGQIGIFRKPDAPGPLKNITLLQRNKRKLEALVESNLRFIGKSDDDFGYTLSEKSRNILHKMKEEMVRNVSTQIRALGSRIEAHLDDRQASETELEVLMSIFKDFSLEVGAFKKISRFADYLRLKYTKDLGVDVTTTTLEVLRDVENHLDFLGSISGEAPVDWSSTIREGMKETVQYLQNSRTWYVLFLSAFYDQFSGYEVQKLRSEYEAKTSKLSKQIHRFQVGSAQKMTLAQLDTLRRLLEEVRNQHLLRIFDSMKEANVTKRQLHFLQVLLNVTLDHPKTIMSCEEDKLVAKGLYVMVSQVVKKFHSCHKQQIRYVEIFALEKVFIDESVNFTGKGLHQFTIVAPVWETIGHVEISLNGAIGRRYERPAQSGENWSQNGRAGEPGAPGGSAAHFVGIGTSFVNGDQLTITSVGGTGGSGQRGGDGHRGEDDVEAQKYNGDGSLNWDTIWPGHKYEQTVINEPGFFAALNPFSGWTDYRVEVYSLQPNQGGHGGNGGNGGRGGRGGSAGEIILWNLDSQRKPSVKCIAADGNRGEAGEGGKGGVGGKRGRTVVETNSITKSYFLGLFNSEESTLSFKEYQQAETGSRPNGGNGLKGWNDEDLKRPIAIPFEKTPNELAKDYQDFAQEYSRNTSHALQTSVQKQFLRKLNRDPL